MNARYFFLVLFLMPFFVRGQVIYSDPPLPQDNQPVTVYFNSSGTPLESYTGDVYTHTGLILEGSSNWYYVIGAWGNNNTQPTLTSLGNHLYSLDITPTIREYYGADSTDFIKKMAFVFRSADAATQTDDLFIDVFASGLNVSITLPDQQPLFVDAGAIVEVQAQANLAQGMSLYLDNVLIATAAGGSLTHSLAAGTDPDTKHRIRVVATDGTHQVADSVYYYIRGAAIVEGLPAGVTDGINYVDNSTVTLVLHAPYKNSIYAFGDFSNWEVEPALKMKRTAADTLDPDNRYWVTITGLTTGVEYAFQYLIDEEMIIAEPYADKVLDPWNDPWIDDQTYPNLKEYPDGKTTGIVSVLQTGQQPFVWQHASFTPPDVTDLVVYELLIRDFIAAHNYQTLIDTLGYLENLGVNAIELMPVMEFEGNLSWGYNPSFYFAPDKYYGTKDKLKEFIDAAHAKGMAVILDIVLNHAFGQCPLVQMYFDPDAGTWGQPTDESPWFNPESTHPYGVGYDFNHESQATKKFVRRVTRYWLTEYDVDGFRFDLSKGFTQKVTTDVNAWGQYDASRIAILKDYADTIWSVNPQAYVILEHFAVDAEEKVLADDGMISWGNLNYNYNEATMGWNTYSNFYRISYQTRGFNDPHLAGYMESHDEERLMAKNIHYGNAFGGYNIQDSTTALQRMELAGAFFFTVPGPKMIWQFGELGYDYYINYPGSITGDDHKTDAKPIRWDYLGDYRRKYLHDVWAALIRLKKNEEVFRTTDFSLALSGTTKRIRLAHPEMNAVVLGNFNVKLDSVNPQFSHTGMWYDYFAGDSLFISDVNAYLLMDPGEYRIFTDKKLEKPQIGAGVEARRHAAGCPVQAWPNPSRGSVTISVMLDRKALLKIDVFDAMGRRLANLADGMYGPGRHTAGYVHPAGAGPGLVFCSVMVDGAREIIKILMTE